MLAKQRFQLDRLLLGVFLSLAIIIGAVFSVRAFAFSHSSSSAPSPTPTIGIAPAYPLPAALASYHLITTDFSSGNVAFLGLATLVTGGNPHGLALQPGGRFLWAMNAGGNNVWVIDLVTRQVVASVPVGPNPVHAVFSPDGRFAYVTNFGGPPFRLSTPGICVSLERSSPRKRPMASPSRLMGAPSMSPVWPLVMSSRSQRPPGR